MVRVIKNRCQPWLYKKAQCRLCVDACPVEGCINLEGNTVRVKTEDCVGCGICTTACPTSALVMEGLADRELWNRLQAALSKGCHCEGTLVLKPCPERSEGTQVPNPQSEISISFGCTLGAKVDEIANRKSQIANHINLPCLAILKESHLISMALYGNNPSSPLLTKSPSFPPLEKGDEGGLKGDKGGFLGANTVYLDISHCSDCSFKHGERVIEQNISYANNLLNAMGYHERIKIIEDRSQPAPLRGARPGKSEERSQKQEVKHKKNLISSFSSLASHKQNIKTITPQPEYSRRELLTFLREKAVEKAVERVVGNTASKSPLNPPFEKGGDGGIKKEGRVEDIPERRALLLEAFKDRGFSSHVQIEDGRFPIHQLKIGEDCTLCHTCNLFCPTGAIKRVEGEEEVRIDFNLALCMGCYECGELCPEGAIHREGVIDLRVFFNGEAKILFKRTSMACPSCSGRFFPEDGVEECLICRKRNYMDELMFGTASRDVVGQGFVTG